MRLLQLLILLSVSLCLPAQAASIDGRYRARIDGVISLLDLKSQGSTLSGIYQEGALQLLVWGSVRDGAFQATLTDPQRKLQVATLEGRIDGTALDTRILTTIVGIPQKQRQVRFESERAPAEGSKVQTGTLDPKLIGSWKNDSVINSGGYGNAASFATARTLIFGADGQLTQWLQSAGGGVDWSHSSGDRKLEFEGRWFTSNGVVHVKLKGAKDFVPIGRYRFVDAYLITENDQGKMTWQRQ